MSLIPETPDVFQNEAALEKTYRRDLFVAEVEPVKRYAENIAPVAKGRSPGTLVLHGGPGTGKSATTQFFFDELEEELTETDDLLTTVHVRLDKDETAYQALIDLVNALHSILDKGELSQTGYGKKDVQKKLIDGLNAFEGLLLIAIDDLHLLNGKEELLNNFSRARERSSASVKVGLVLITNDASFVDQLPSDTQSRLRPKQIAFSGYNREEIYEIIGKRAQKAFREDLVSESALRMCVARATNEGDVRYGLDLLKEAGEQVCGQLRDSDESRLREMEITNEDISRADKILQGNWYSSTVSSLTPREQHLLYVATMLTCKGKTPCRTKDIHRLYTQVFEDITVRRLRDSLSNLATQGVLMRYDRNKGKKSNGEGGQYYEYELNEELSTVLKALKRTEISYIADEEINSLCRKAVRGGTV